MKVYLAHGKMSMHSSRHYGVKLKIMLTHDLFLCFVETLRKPHDYLDPVLVSQASAIYISL